jgi:hypothetical protein
MVWVSVWLAGKQPLSELQGLLSRRGWPITSAEGRVEHSIQARYDIVYAKVWRNVCTKSICVFQRYTPGDGWLLVHCTIDISFPAPGFIGWFFSFYGNSWNTSLLEFSFVHVHNRLLWHGIRASRVLKVRENVIIFDSEYFGITFLVFSG